MKALAERYAGRAAFLFVYCRDAHRRAGQGGEYLRGELVVRRAANAAERARGAALLRARVEPARRILVDGFGDASLYERLFAGSGADDPCVVVDADGRVAAVLRWTNAADLEPLLRDLPPGPPAGP